MVVKERVALSRRFPSRGDEIKYAWYPNFVVKEWITSFKNSMGTFHAVLLDAGDMFIDTGRRLPPVWVFESNGEFSIWHDVYQRPRSISQSDFDVERVICHFEAQDGAVYYAVELSQFVSPVWLLDTKENNQEAIQTYCLRLGIGEKFT